MGLGIRTGTARLPTAHSDCPLSSAPTPTADPFSQLFQRDAVPKPSPANGHIETGLGKRRRNNQRTACTGGNRNETFRLGLGQAADQIPPAHARVDQDRHRARLEQPEDQRDEVDARPNQQGQPRAGQRADAVEPSGDTVAVVVELAEGDVPVPPLALGVVTQRLGDSDRVGHGLSYR